MAQRRARDTRRFTFVANDIFDNPKFAAFERRDLHTMVAVATAAWIVSNDTTGDGEILARSALRKADAVGVMVELDGQEMSVADAMTHQGLWHRPGHTCEKCPQPKDGRVQLHDIGLHQRLKAEREELSAKRSKYGKEGADKRWEPLRAAKRAAAAAQAAQQGELPFTADAGEEPVADAMASAIAKGMANPMASAMASASEQLDREPDVPARRPRAVSTRGRTKIRADFAASETMRTWAKEHAADVDVDSETERFVTYWRGRGTLQEDWGSQWQSWMLGEQNKKTAGGRRGAARGPYRSPAGGTDELRNDWGTRESA